MTKNSESGHASTKKCFLIEEKSCNNPNNPRHWICLHKTKFPFTPGFRKSLKGFMDCPTLRFLRANFFDPPKFGDRMVGRSGRLQAMPFCLENHIFLQYIFFWSILTFV